MPVKIMPITTMNQNSGEIGFDMSEEINVIHSQKDAIRLEEDLVKGII
jgi:hypothetical protein